MVANFGVDNGIFAWLDGNYLFGARAGGGPILGEYSLNLGDLAAGTHYLQLLLEDHGGSNGYAVQITADTFISAPVPEPATRSPSWGWGSPGWDLRAVAGGKVSRKRAASR